MQNDPHRHASEEETALAFAALSTADYVRLGRIAQLRARGLPEVDWRDLVQEATERTLSGSRRWPLDVPFLAFLAETVRSVASEAWRRRARERTRTASAEPEALDQLEAVADDAPDPERAAVARDLAERLSALFADDPQAHALLSGMAEGLSPSELASRLGVEARTYDTVRRRMRRKLARLDPETLL